MKCGGFKETTNRECSQGFFNRRHDAIQAERRYPVHKFYLRR